MKRLASYFFQGLFFVAPVGLTVFIVWKVVSTVDAVLPLGVPGLGLIAALVLITLVGLLTSNVAGRAAMRLTDAVLKRVPLVQLLYTSLRDLLDAFVGDKRSFERPVAVELAPSGPLVLGFLTCEEPPIQQLEGHVVVYLPQSYNFAGNLIVVPRERVRALAVPSRGLMAFILSAGVSSTGLRAQDRPQAPPGPAPDAGP